MLRILKLASAALLVFLCLNDSASAVVLLADGFNFDGTNYAVGANLTGQTNTAYNKQWLRPGLPSGGVQTIADPDVEYPGLVPVAVDSNSVALPRPTNANQSFNRINIPGGPYTRASGTTLFYSYTLEMTSWVFFAPPAENPSDINNDAAAKNVTNRRGGHLGGFHGGDAAAGNMQSANGFAGAIYVRRELDMTVNGTDGTPGLQTGRYELGIAKSLANNLNLPATESELVYNTDQSFAVGDKLLIVGQYDFVDTAASQSPGVDIARMWVNPTPGDVSAEATPFKTAPSSTFYPNMGGTLPIFSFYLKADDVSPGNFRVDNVRVGQTFADVIPALPPDEDGDFNEDGNIDMLDYVIWRADNNTTHTEQDYDTWAANYGNPSPGSGTSSAVPEPGTLVGILIAAMAVAVRRRSR